MARQLTKEAKAAVESNSALFKKVSDALRVKPVSLPKLLTRQSDRLVSREVVDLIAEATGMHPDQVEEEKPVEDK